MAEVIVNSLEVVDIGQNYSQRVPLAAAACQFFSEHIANRAPITYAR